MTLAVRRVSDDVCVDLGLEVVAWAAQSERPFFSRSGAIFNKRAEDCDIFNQVWSHRFGDRFKRSSLPVILAVFSCLQIRGQNRFTPGKMPQRVPLEENSSSPLQWSKRKQKRW